MNSLKNLINAPYNRNHLVKALFRYVYWKLIRLGKRSDVKFNLWGNRKIFLNHDSFQSMWLMYNYYVDWEEFNLIKRYVRTGDQVFDIGANMGFYTIWMSKFITSGRIHSFEPDAGNFERLTNNIRINNLGTVVANKLAVSDVDGSHHFTEGLDGENHIALEAIKGAIQIEAVTLDRYAKERKLESIRYIKIDVEGFEFAVLAGATGLLARKAIKVIQLEINNTIQNSGKKVDELVQFLTQYDYELCSYEVESNELKPIMFSPRRENYFAVSDLADINRELKNSSLKKESA